MRIVASIEARMGSSRLPGKVLMDVEGQPAIARLVNRLKRAKLLDDIVLATSRSKLDDPLAEWAERAGVRVFRGSEDDVLGRVVGAHEFMKSDVVVEITGDCTLLDPEVVDLGIRLFRENDADVVSNTWKLSYPMGIDVQVFRAKDLAWVAQNIADPAVREHVSIYFYENPDKYRTLHFFAPERWNAPEQRTQLDYEEDLEFIRQVYRRLEPKFGEGFGTGEILELLAREPHLKAINAHCTNKPIR